MATHGEWQIRIIETYAHGQHKMCDFEIDGRPATSATGSFDSVYCGGALDGAILRYSSASLKSAVVLDCGDRRLSDQCVSYLARCRGRRRHVMLFRPMFTF
eukprot:COSAG02_NODE_6408_length_3593_cov_2.949914_2_plen_101_part_00